MRPSRLIFKFVPEGMAGIVLSRFPLRPGRRGALMPLLLVTLAASPARAQTSGFLLSEGPGKLVDSLLAAAARARPVTATLTAAYLAALQPLSGTVSLRQGVE